MIQKLQYKPRNFETAEREVREHNKHTIIDKHLRNKTDYSRNNTNNQRMRPHETKKCLYVKRNYQSSKKSIQK